MTSYLKKGAWCQFKTALLLKKWSLPVDLSRKIFMILQTEELRERYLSGFPCQLSSEKLDLSLDDIIDPIGIGEKKSQERNCHPGRLSLNPDAYHHAYTMSLSPERQMVRETMRCGPNGDWVGKHRLLDRPELDNGTTWYPQGLHDVYFLGGLPLIYWSRRNAMGMRVMTEPLYHAHRDDQRTWQRTDGFQWKSAKDLSEYTRMWYLPTEKATLEVPLPKGWTPRSRTPRTYWGNQRYIDRHAGGKTPVDEVLDGSNDTYIGYIQVIEDIYRASATRGIHSENFCRIFAEELSGVQVNTLGGW